MDSINIIIVLLIFAVILIAYFIYSNYKMSKEMGCLTGKYMHIKKPTGVHINVEYIDNGFVQWRPATNQEIIILKKYKFML